VPPDERFETREENRVFQLHQKARINYIQKKVDKPDSDFIKQQVASQVYVRGIHGLVMPCFEKMEDPKDKRYWEFNKSFVPNPSCKSAVQVRIN